MVNRQAVTEIDVLTLAWNSTIEMEIKVDQDVKAAHDIQLIPMLIFTHFYFTHY